MRFPSLCALWFASSLCGALPLARTQQFVDTVPLPSAGYLHRYLPPADVDGDGDVDLVACTPTGVRLFRNDGANRFGGGVVVDPLSGSLAGAVADFDGDGDGDIAVFSPASPSQSTTLYLLRNGGTTFATSVAHQPTTATIEPMFLLPVDVDGDGDLDLLAALGQGPLLINSVALLVLANDGTGQFSDVTASWLAPPGPAAVSYVGAQVLDFDVDGRSDVLLYSTTLRLLRNTGTQLVDETALRLPPMPLGLPPAASIGDIDGDGDPDLLVLLEGQPPLLLRNSAGVFADVTSSLLAPLPAVEQAAFLDVDRDGDRDLFVRGGSPATALLVTNAGGGSLLTVQPAPDFRDRPGVSQVARYAIHRCDLEGDGDDDLVLPYEYAGVLRGDGHGNLVDPWSATRLGGSTTLDADGDGDADLLTPAGLAVNDGFGAFTTVPFTGATPNGPAIADFDNDGDDDVGGFTAVYLSNGGGAFTAVPFAAQGIGIGTFAFDFDADGNVDLLHMSFGSPPRLFRNVGGGTMVLAQALTGTARFADAADVDLDGDLDLVVSGGFGGGMLLWLQSAPGVFVAGAFAPLFDRAVFADLAGSGVPDVVVGGASPRLLRIVSGTFVDVTGTTLLTRFSGSEILVGDVDADGDVDLVADQLLRNDGTGRLTLERLDLRGTSRGLRDLDGDGDLDLIVGSGNNLHACWNREHHIDVPLPATAGRPLRLDVSALPGRASALELAIVGVGLTRSAPGIATPFGELRLGAIGLTLGLQITPVTGISALSLQIPANPGLVGTDLHFQALHFGPSGWLLGNLASTRIE